MLPPAACTWHGILWKARPTETAIQKSPGIDRPLKKDKDFERAMGMEVELKLFKAIDGQKEFTGELIGYDKENVVLLIVGEEKTFGRKAASLIKPVVDMDGVQDVDMGDTDEEMNVGDEIEIGEE